jgi:16S rRNA (guanine1207-N2)-methyltransferase
MDPRSEVLLRQRALFTGNLLLAGLPADDLLAQLPAAHGWSWHVGEHATLSARFTDRCQFGIQAPERAFDAAVLFLPKSRELCDYLLQALAARLAGRELFLVGEKRAGIERAAKQLQPYGKPRKLDSARHCQLWQVTVEQAPAVPDLSALAQRYELPLADGPLQVISLPGVFSHGRLDRGTALLLQQLDNLPAGHLLDFGCGAGVLGATLKRRYPQSQISMLDVDAFALESSRLTLAANGLEAEVIGGDGIHAAPLALDAILTNPPFHQGVHTEYQATETLLRQAAQHLKPGGELRLVANSFLKYPPLIEEHLGPCVTLGSGDGFHLYQAKRPQVSKPPGREREPKDPSRRY